MSAKSPKSDSTQDAKKIKIFVPNIEKATANDFLIAVMDTLKIPYVKPKNTPKKWAEIIKKKKPNDPSGT